MFDQLRAMAIFAKVAEAGSFRGAARLVSLSPSVVSQQVSALEQRLGVALIYQSTRSFSLTSDGEQLLTSAQAMISAAEEGLSHFSSLSSEPVGVLRVTIPAILTATPIVDSLAAFADAYPGIALHLSFSDSRRDVIRDGFDLAIRMGWLKDSSLKAKKLGEASRRLVASPAYAAKYEKPESPADLEAWRFIRFEPRPDETELIHPKLGKATVIGETQISVDSSGVLRRLALAGAGLAELLAFDARLDLEAGRLVEILPTWRLPSPGVYAVWPPNAPRQSLARKLVRFLDERLTRFDALW